MQKLFGLQKCVYSHCFYIIQAMNILLNYSRNAGAMMHKHVFDTISVGYVDTRFFKKVLIRHFVDILIKFFKILFLYGISHLWFPLFEILISGLIFLGE